MFKFNGKSSAEKYNEYLDKKWFILNRGEIYKILLGHLTVILALVVMLNFDCFNSADAELKVILSVFCIPWVFAMAIQIIYLGMGAITPTVTLMHLPLIELASRIIIYPYGYVLGNQMLSESQNKTKARHRRNASPNK